MSKGIRPNCIGLHGSSDDCSTCSWEIECKKMTEDIESSIFRKGTHTRIVSKYKEKKYKPKRLP